MVSPCNRFSGNSDGCFTNTSSVFSRSNKEPADNQNGAGNRSACGFLPFTKSSVSNSSSAAPLIEPVFCVHEQSLMFMLRVINMFKTLVNYSDEQTKQIDQIQFIQQLACDIGLLADNLDKYVYLQLVIKFCELSKLNVSPVSLVDIANGLGSELGYHPDYIDSIKGQIEPYFNELYGIFLIGNIKNINYFQLCRNIYMPIIMRIIELVIVGVNPQIRAEVEGNFICQVEVGLNSLNSTCEKYFYLKIVQMVCSRVKITLERAINFVNGNLDQLCKNIPPVYHSVMFNIDFKLRLEEVCNFIYELIYNNFQQQAPLANKLAKKMLFEIKNLLNSNELAMVMGDGDVIRYLHDACERDIDELSGMYKDQCLYLVLILKICDDNKLNNIRSVFELMLNEVEQNKPQEELPIDELWRNSEFTEQFYSSYDEITHSANY